ncbi:hypothetical protein CLOSTASPAR_00929 [[Clostridium] asparagiforme DSM 15981]|uniref:Uncharacterized protein n=1 Tax=[Clostridium] asparagiforme DSM 15981 TaxID=518636 RepID=C0CVC6_9FIRM|nr:hypothetical protein CLOSTASPAR_00929 [[Clostridium] asparagiforme DSM 15981]
MGGPSGGQWWPRHSLDVRFCAYTLIKMKNQLHFHGKCANIFHMSTDVFLMRTYGRRQFTGRRRSDFVKGRIWRTRVNTL